ncbi:uncharacterized protein LOC135693695 [Rhopilema esculentum]|uniref:uncharacterized protein LOC135693695 n=1 Tax=Rhopilema esculentum TaxID=499914 RepID=UPI0031D80346|eukprot:gene2695-905_t
MPKKKLSQKDLLKPAQTENKAASSMLQNMASAELSPMMSKKRTLREAVNEIRQKSPASPKLRLISALQKASSIQHAVFMNEGLSKKVTESLSSQDVRDLHLVFDVFDVDKSGYIDYGELRKACKILGFNLKKDEIQRMLADLDVDKSGQIDFNEFLEFIISRQGDDRDIFSEINQGFKLFNKSGTGKITFEDLKWASKETGVNLTDIDIKGMIYEADKDGDNEINLDEFISIMLQTNLFYS